MKKRANFVRTSISLPPIVAKWLTTRSAEFGLKASGYMTHLLVEDMKRAADAKEACK